MSTDITELMRQDWDERARKDAFHYIASWRKDWNPQSFFQSGEEDFAKLVKPVLDSSNWSPAGKSMLELGCGAGRMTHIFSQQFARVYAFDISSEMLRHAKALNPEVMNVEWTLGNGRDLGTLSDESLDFVFSYIVLQHLPRPELAISYVREMLRVLKPGGMFLFQFNSLLVARMNWKGRMAWNIVDYPWELGFREMSRTLATLLGLSPEIAGKSWRGAALDVAAVRECVKQERGEVLGMQGSGTPMTWCHGLKSAACPE